MSNTSIEPPKLLKVLSPYVYFIGAINSVIIIGIVLIVFHRRSLRGDLGAAKIATALLGLLALSSVLGYGAVQQKELGEGIELVLMLVMGLNCLVAYQSMKWKQQLTAGHADQPRTPEQTQ